MQCYWQHQWPLPTQASLGDPYRGGASSSSSSTSLPGSSLGLRKDDEYQLSAGRRQALRELRRQKEEEEEGNPLDAFFASRKKEKEKPSLDSDPLLSSPLESAKEEEAKKEAKPDFVHESDEETTDSGFAEEGGVTWGENRHGVKTVMAL